MLSNNHILVTGGAGMIGSNLVKRLVRNGNRVTVVDNLSRGKLEYLSNRSGPVINLNQFFHQLDLSVPGILDSLLVDVDYIFHLADLVAGIGYVFSNQGEVFRQNLLINSNVITSVKKFSPKGFLYVGTACSFPTHKQTGVDALPLKEEDMYPAAPESAYGWSKLMGEYESFLMEAETNIPVSVLTLHNVYGAPCDFSDTTGQVVPSLIRKAIYYPKEPFVVWGSGEQGRAFIYTDDVVDALLRAMECGLGHGMIQIGTNVCTNIREIAETIVEISGKDILIQFDRSKPEGDRGRCADYSKAQGLLGWMPRVSLCEGLSRTYQWVESKIRETGA